MIRQTIQKTEGLTVRLGLGACLPPHHALQFLEVQRLRIGIDYFQALASGDHVDVVLRQHDVVFVLTQDLSHCSS